MTRQTVLAAFAAGMLLTAFDPAAFAALEQSSKKECALCHVMWLDTFRTNRETLIQWQPGNVLMKDTQGIVSAEAMCYSCHDGYVADSRFTTWEKDNHPVFKKPPKEMIIPPALTLSNKDEMYCGTCHSPHSGREAAPGASREETIPGPMSFLKLPNSDSSLCEACHVDETDFKRSKGHPMHVDTLKIPGTLLAHGRAKAGKNDTVICESCHAVHGAAGRHLTVMDNRESALCMACHKERTLAGTPHDLRQTMPTETNRLGQPVSDSGPCGACHVPHRSGGYRLWARKIAPGNPASQACLSCHRNTPGNPIKGTGRYSHPIDMAATPKGMARASATVPPLSLPVFTPSGTERPGGSMQCATCHTVHQWNPDNPDDRGGKNANSDASNSFLRMSASRSSALCLACHQDRRSLLAHGHNLVLTAPQAMNIRGDTAAVSGPCGACHLPHHAENKALWARPLFPENGSPPLYCRGCHAPTGAAKAKPVGKRDHPVDVVLTGKDMPPPARVTDTLPLFNAQGGVHGGTRIMCRTCHEPHAWAADAMPTDRSGEATGTSVRQMEGNAGNSFLRRAATPNQEPVRPDRHRNRPLRRVPCGPQQRTGAAVMGPDLRPGNGKSPLHGPLVYRLSFEGCRGRGQNPTGSHPPAGRIDQQHPDFQQPGHGLYQAIRRSLEGGPGR
ncbi:MAG: cytochrome c3 family protein [Desulfosarcinaceae bacterium]